MHPEPALPPPSAPAHPSGFRLHPIARAFAVPFLLAVANLVGAWTLQRIAHSIPAPVLAGARASGLLGGFLLLGIAVRHLTARSTRTPDLDSAFRGAAQMLVALSLIPWAAIVLAPTYRPIARWVTRYPDEAATLACAVILLEFVRAATRAPGLRRLWTTFPGARRAGRTPALHPADARVVSVHEAGHVLTMAALDRSIPPHALAEVGRTSRGTPGGHVSFWFEAPADPQLWDELTLRWHLYHSLSGLAAERILLASPSDGCAEDIAGWEHSAHAFLRLGTRGHFFAAPRTAAEAAHNAAALSALRAECERALAEFLHANLSILEAVADTLLQDRVLRRDQIAALTAELVVPPAFPSPRAPCPVARTPRAAP